MALRTGLILTVITTLIGGSAMAADVSPRVKEIIGERCQLCHGVDGEAASAIYPRLAAQNETYIVKQLHDFRDGRRIGTMNEMAKDLTDADIASLASYFSGKKPHSKRASNAELAAVGQYIFRQGNPYSGIPACASCHGETGHGTEQLPRLAGQHPAYLESQIGDFVSGTRTNDKFVMRAIATKLTPLELKAVATYIGGLE